MIGTGTCDYKQECNDTYDGACSNTVCLCTGFSPGECKYSTGSGMCECKLHPTMANVFKRYGYGPVIVGTVGVVCIIVFWTGIIWKTWRMGKHEAPRNQPYAWYANSRARSRPAPVKPKPKEQQEESIPKEPCKPQQDGTPPFTIKVSGTKLSDGNIIYRGHYYYPDSINRFLADVNDTYDPPPYSLEVLPNLPPYSNDPSSFLTDPASYPLNFQPPPSYRATPPPYPMDPPPYPFIKDGDIQMPNSPNPHSPALNRTGENLPTYPNERDDANKMENSIQIPSNSIGTAVRRMATSSEAGYGEPPTSPPPNYTENQ
ncbi:unnamed protein product [Meganyctiphanes norvegica]|uniref:EGF-like domain-containing protein n=1 Tax=Meganyctiphanes norvegica TaxID=48144 RepID=A0AAV2QMV0_MEGNR